MIFFNKLELKELEYSNSLKRSSFNHSRVSVSATSSPKIEICLARGKKNYDKRNSLKEKDIKRNTNRYVKEN